MLSNLKQTGLSPSVTASLVVILVLLIALFSGCVVKHIPMPMPVVGIDIARVSVGQVVPFNGTIMSDYYLNEYLQYKCTDENKC